MEAAANQENRDEEPQRNKQCLFIMGMYILLTLSSNFTLHPKAYNQNVVEIIKNAESGDPSLRTILNVFNTDSYDASWVSLGEGISKSLNMGVGKSTISLHKFGGTDSFDYSLEFQMNNGEYIDGGSVTFRTYIQSEKWEATRNGTRITVSPRQPQANETIEITALYRYKHILDNIEEKVLKLEQMSLVMQYEPTEDSLTVYFEIPQLLVRNTIVKSRSNTFSVIIFAIILFIISFSEFAGIMDMLRRIFDGREGSGNYSMLTILMATMWDAALCITTFIEAFQSDESLILYILPAFILCLLFTNLELRLMLMIFQSRHQDANIREVICKFNLIAYGGLLLMYPILIYTNLSPLLFIGFSLIFLPQIYTNAVNGHRPDISSPYYTKFLSLRFLLVFYLRGFPWNIFQLQPSFFLIVFCILLVSFQGFLLWTQKNHGPKKVIPKFLLPPVFNYGGDVDLNIEEGAGETECPICLCPLHQECELEAAYEVPFRLMRAPCNHIFHGVCLSKWMQIKMECPQCRGKLPPFE